MKQTVFDHLPPATLLAIWPIFGLAPDRWIESAWLLPVVFFGSMIFIQLMELVHERHEGWRINRQELATDIFYMVFVVVVIGAISEIAVEAPLLGVKEQLGFETPWMSALPFLAQVLIIMMMIEFGQYWLHRWMHNNDFLWSTHAPHHHVTQLNALKGFIGHPIELFLLSLSVVALFDFDANAVLAALVSLVVVTQYAHANIRSNPPAWYGFLFTTIRHHSLHHTALSYEDTRCNYSNSMIVFDRIFGTFKDGESEIVGQDDRPRLSIREQFLFPVTFYRNKYREKAKQ